ncbi:MAG: M48 family metalloprotease [Rhodospirillales bacterium]|nr:M48 family metalloprotease [Rhodospirillales bacterium]
MKQFLHGSIAILLPLLIFVAGCAVNPATGDRQFMLMSSAAEQKLGAEEHPKLVSQFGGRYEDADLTRYVEHVGASLAAVTEAPDIPFTFSLLDNETVNAFALPGGYVHITRGLLALADNEAELAGVLAHEIGHVVARHTAERYSQSIGAGLLATVVGAAGSAAGVPIGDLAATGAQAFVQSYSRDQELEADELAVRYLRRAGYDPQGMATFLRKLEANTRLEATLAGDPAAADRFNIMASHPRTADRVQQAIVLAAGGDVTGARIGREDYLKRIDGILYGENPKQGVQIGREFLHPTLRIAFLVPPGFSITNTPGAVIAKSPRGAMVVFDMEHPERASQVDDMVTYVDRGIGAKLHFKNLESIAVNGMAAATGAALVRGQRGAVDLRVVAIRERQDRIYRFAFLSSPAVTGSLASDFKDTTYSFRQLSGREAARIKPLRVKVIPVHAGDTAEILAAQMPFSNYRVERFRTLNGLDRHQPLAPGETVKTIVN